MWITSGVSIGSARIEDVIAVVTVVWPAGRTGDQVVRDWTGRDAILAAVMDP